MIEERTSDYLCELACEFQASSFEDAVRQAGGWAADPERPGGVWRVKNLATGESRLVDFDDVVCIRIGRQLRCL